MVRIMGICGTRRVCARSVILRLVCFLPVVDGGERSLYIGPVSLTLQRRDGLGVSLDLPHEVESNNTQKNDYSDLFSGWPSRSENVPAS